jgi:DNA-binding CsgD family transcriptional regulator
MNETGAVISEPVLCRSFVGRVAELAHLAERRREAAARRGGTVLVAGEAGIGKSRLLAEFRRSLPRRTVRVASASCREFAQRPLGPWLEVLEALDPQAASLLTAGTFRAKEEQMAALVDVFSKLAQRSTTVVILEDLHWADADTMRVLLVLTQRSAQHRLLFAATYRDDELVDGHPGFSLLSRLVRERRSSLVKLAPFDDREMAQLLSDSTHGNAALSPDEIRDVARRADGNALFGEELLRHAIDRRRHGAKWLADSLPISLDAIVRERLERCLVADRAILASASLLGRSFDVEILADALHVPLKECTAAMERLADLQLVIRAPATSKFRFRHALTRDAVYGEIPAGKLRQMHGRLAETIAEHGAAERHAEWLAHHYALAGEHDRAAPHALAAGNAARALHAYEDAGFWYELAARSFGDSAEAPGALVNAGLMHVFGNQVDRALVLYDSASGAYVRAGRYDDAIAARVMAAGAMHDNGRFDDAIALLRETDERLGETATRSVRDRLLVRLGFLYAFARRTDEAWTVAGAIAEETLGAVTALAAEAHFLRSALHAQRAEVTQWRAHLERGLEIFERIGALPDNVRAALGNAGLQALSLGESSPAREYQTRALHLARELDSGVDYESAVMAEIELLRGNLSEAHALCRTQYGPAKFIARTQRTLVTVLLAVLRGFGDLERFVDAEMLDEAIKGGQRAAAIKLSTAFALLLETLGRRADANRLLRRASEMISTTYDMTIPIVTIARLRPGLMVNLRPTIERAARRPGDRVAQALLAFLDASQARQGRDRITALASGRRAAAQFAALGWPLLAAYAHELAGDDDRAREAYRKLGAHGELRRIERDRAQPDGRSSSSLLTPRERELARAIADGKSNRAAANALSVSEKMVEKHLTSIYAKLGMHSRAQLVAYVTANLTAERERDPSE